MIVLADYFVRRRNVPMHSVARDQCDHAESLAIPDRIGLDPERTCEDSVLHVADASVFSFTTSVRVWIDVKQGHVFAEKIVDASGMRVVICQLNRILSFKSLHVPHRLQLVREHGTRYLCWLVGYGAVKPSFLLRVFGQRRGRRSRTLVKDTSSKRFANRALAAIIRAVCPRVGIETQLFFQKCYVFSIRTFHFIKHYHPLNKQTWTI